MKDIFGQDSNETSEVTTVRNSSPNSWKIAFCPPQFEFFQKAMCENEGDATYLLQRHIAKGLMRQGHNLTYIAPQKLGEFVCTTDIQNPSSAPLTWSGSWGFSKLNKNIWRLQRALHVPYLNIFTNYRFYDACMQCLPGHDIVYERNSLYQSGVAKACQRLKIPYVLFAEADEVFEHDFRGEPITGLLRWRASSMIAHNLNAADCIVCVSQPLKEHLSTKWKIPVEKMVVFPNGVDVQEFKPDEEQRSRARTELGMDNSAILLFVGNFYEWHDVETLLDSFAMVLQANPDVRLVLVGDGYRRQAMEQHAAKLGIQQATHFTGRIPYTNVPALINAADITVAPVPATIQNMWLSPLKLFEYMATGTAVIASGIGHINEVIKERQNGLLVSPGNSADLAEAITTLLHDKDLRTKLGQQAREDALQKHSWDHYFSRLERVFHAVIHGQPVSQI